MLFVWNNLEEAPETLELKMCTLFTEKPDYLKYLIRLSLYKVASHTRSTKNGSKIPTIDIEFCFIIVICSVFSCFGLKSTSRVSLRTAEVRKTREHDSGQLSEETFTKLQTSNSKQIYITTETSHKQIGKTIYSQHSCLRWKKFVFHFPEARRKYGKDDRILVQIISFLQEEPKDNAN